MVFVMNNMDQAWGDIGNEPVAPVLQKPKMVPSVEIIFVQENIRSMRVVLDQLNYKLIMLANNQNFTENHTQAIREIEEEMEFYEHVIDDMTETYRKLYKEVNATKLASLKEERQTMTESMDQLMVDQHKHYKLQKERFESCKHKYGKNHTRFFPERDQEFIYNHRAANEAAWNEWLMLYSQREILTEEIESIDPDDADY